MTVIDDLRSRIAEGSAGVIVGPGVSVAATQGNHVANWVGLLRSGISWSEDNVPATPAGWPAVVRGLLDLGDVSSLVSAAAMLTERLGGREGGEYRVWLRKTIGSMTLVNAAVPEALVGLGIPVATTNYDSLLEQSASGWTPVTWRDGTRLQRVIQEREPQVVHLLGFWDDPASVVLGVRSFEDTLGNAAAQAIQMALANLTCLILVGMGSEEEDPNVGALWDWLRRVRSRSEYRHFRLCREDEAATLAAEDENEGIVPVAYGHSYSDLAPFLHALIGATRLAPSVLASQVVEVSQSPIRGDAVRTATKDFFISYTGADRSWAEWIAWQLEVAGYSVVLQAWDFDPGANFVLEMDRASKRTERTLLVLSERSLASTYVKAEWAARFRDDPTGEGRRLLPVRIEPCDVRGLLGAIVYVDLVYLEPQAAVEALIASVATSRRKPERAPDFPGGKTRSVSRPPRFPGPLATRPDALATQSRRGSYDVFLSHAHEDAPVVEKLAIRLTDEGGIKPWLDRWVLVPGERWQQAVARGLDEAQCCAVCVGKQRATGWFREEIERALNRQVQDEAFRVIPVLLPQADPLIIDQFLELRTWVRFDLGLDDGAALALLLSGIRGVPPGRPSMPIDDVVGNARNRLLQIKRFLVDDLIEREVALEYQRKIIDDILRG